MTASPSPASPPRNRAGAIAILALVAGFIIGALVRASNETVARGLLALADPIGTLWVNAIRMTVIPLVVSLLVTGIVQSEDSRSVGRLGVRALAVM